MRTHHLEVAPWNYIYVSEGRKHFIVIPDTIAASSLRSIGQGPIPPVAAVPIAENAVKDVPQLLAIVADLQRIIRDGD